MRKLIKTKIKMKKILAVLSIAIFITSCQKQKIGYVDNGKVINEMQEKVDLEKKYETKLNAFNAKKDSIGRAFQMEAQKFQMEAQKMSQSKAQAKYEELGQKQQMLQQQFQMEQQQISKPYQEEMDSLITKVKDYVKEYGKTNGFDVILGTVESSPSVMYAKDEYDLTETIIKDLDNNYKK